jgi:hypothetical protein
MKEQDYNWIKKCIDSCTNEWQLFTAWELILLFERKYSNCEEMELLNSCYLNKQTFLNI